MINLAVENIHLRLLRRPDISKGLYQLLNPWQTCEIGRGFFILIFRINIKLITTLNEKGLLKKLSYFLYLKKKHNNSCLYDYSPYKLSKRFGFSPTKHRANITWLIEQKWCRLHNGNVIFNSLSEISRLYEVPTESKRITIKPEQWKVRDIYDQLLLFFIKTEINKQNFVISIKSDLNNPINLKRYKRSVKLAKKFNIKKGEKTDTKTRLSVFSVAKIFNCSIGSASNVLSRLKKAGLIVVKSNIKVICACPKKAFKYLEDIAGCFYYCGMILKREANEVMLSVK